MGHGAAFSVSHFRNGKNAENRSSGTKRAGEPGRRITFGHRRNRSGDGACGGQRKERTAGERSGGYRNGSGSSSAGRTSCRTRLRCNPAGSGQPAVQPAVFFCRYGAFSFAGWRSLPHFPCRKCRSLLCQNSIPCAEGADEGAVSPRSGRRGARQFFFSL